MDKMNNNNNNNNVDPHTLMILDTLNYIKVKIIEIVIVYII